MEYRVFRFHAPEWDISHLVFGKAGKHETTTTQHPQTIDTVVPSISTSAVHLRSVATARCNSLVWAGPACRCSDQAGR